MVSVTVSRMVTVVSFVMGGAGFGGGIAETEVTTIGAGVRVTVCVEIVVT